MNGLIGYTGFVGNNLDKQYIFEKKYNSKNIEKIQGEEFELLICSGVSAVKWFANQNPEKDIEGINNLIENLKTIKVKNFVLISTIDIYDTMEDVNEDSIPNIENQDSYGRNRYFLENWVKSNFENSLILRLPALFGDGLKKNFVYDLMNPIPSSIVNIKWEELKNSLSEDNFKTLSSNYLSDENGNFKFDQNISKDEKNKVENIFKNYGFTSLNFTDTRSSFPFYFLDNLKKDIDLALKNSIPVLNLSVEPITCKELAKEILNLEVNNEIENRQPVHYDMNSKYFEIYKGKDGYLYSKEQTFEFLKSYFKREGFQCN